MPNYTVQQGDCVSAIAKKFHIGDWSVIFNHPSNKALRDKRKNPNVLYPGDVLFIPDVEAKDHPVASGAPHRFQVRTPKKSVSILLEDAEGHALADLAFKLVVEGETLEGKTDGKGKLETQVPADAKQGQLTVGKFTWTLQIGHLNPIEHAPDDGSSGLLHRLRNLGYSLAEGVKVTEEAAKSAIATFQARSGLPLTGELDDATRKKLTEHHEEGAKKSAQAPPPKPGPKPEPKPTAPRLATPPAGAPEEGYYDRAKHALGTFYDWMADGFQHDSGSGHAPTGSGMQKAAPIAPSVKDAPTANVLSGPCTCFVCTFKLTVVQKSHEDHKAAHARISGVAAPPAKPEDMLSWFHDEPFRINIVGVRRRHSFSNALDDAIFTFFRVGADTGTDEWKPVADKYGLKNQDWVVGKSTFVPCKRFGGFWVSCYDVSTDPGWEEAKDGTDISMAVLNAGDGSPEDKHTLRSGEAFVCPLWYKGTWRLGAHHKNGYGGHLALVQAKDALIERLNYPKVQGKPAAVPWLRVYKDGKDPADYGNVVYHITSKAAASVNGATTIDLDEDDVIGSRYLATVGMNIHRAHRHPAMGGPSTGTKAGFGQGKGTAYSEGCQIFADSAQFDQFLRQCQFSKWWQCKGKPCKKITSAAMFTEMGFNEVVHKQGKADYKQLACYESDYVSSCDDGVCGVRYDYVLVELTAKDLDKIRADFDKLGKTYTFKNDNKLFVGGSAPAAGSGGSTPATPALPTPPATPAVVAQVAAVITGPVSTCTCGSTIDPLYRDPKTTKVSAEDMNAAVVRVWKLLVGPGKSPDLVEDAAMVLVGQWGLETGWGAKMMNYNFGNVKRGSAKILFTAFTTSEYYKTEKGALDAANCSKHSRILGHNPKGWGAAFDPPHRQTYFRAYETLDDGVKAHFAVLQNQSNFVAGWKCLADHADGNGTSAAEKERHDRLQKLGLAFGTALKTGHYATAADYDEQMAQMAISVWRRLKASEYAAWKAAHPKKKVVIGA